MREIHLVKPGEIRVVKPVKFGWSILVKSGNKALLHDKYVLELAIYEVPKSDKYPKGLKFRLICIDPVDGHRVLFDNHHPKGPHFHLDNEEFDYEFQEKKNSFQIS